MADAPSGALSAPDRPRAAATIGVFDGVHRGHQSLIDRVVRAARSLPGVAVAVTFARHPLAVLAPDRCPEPLSTVEERRALLRAHGIADVIALDFDRAMSALTAREFLDRVLLRRYDLRVLVVGPDFAMGRNRRGDLAALGALGAELGFTLDVVAPVPALGGPVSSTRLRRAIAEGDVGVARELLGRDYEIGGRVVSGHGRGRGLGYPTANVAVDPGKMVPADGVYAARVALVPVLPAAGGDPGATAGVPWQPAAVNIGLAPTFGGTERRVEVHVLDFGGDLRGGQLFVRFVARLRGEMRFPDAGALRTQIAADIARARALLERDPDGP
jgi:riboflavin kinase/FMN adenylyltransferase